MSRDVAQVCPTTSPLDVSDHAWHAAFDRLRQYGLTHDMPEGQCLTIVNNAGRQLEMGRQLRITADNGARHAIAQYLPINDIARIPCSSTDNPDLCTAEGDRICTAEGDRLCTAESDRLCTAESDRLCTAESDRLCTAESDGLCTAESDRL
jgi:hypothetical protein